MHDILLLLHDTLRRRRFAVMSSRLTGQSIGCSTICSDGHQTNMKGPPYCPFRRVIHRWPVDSPHKGTVTRKMFLFDDIIMKCKHDDAMKTISTSLVITWGNHKSPLRGFPHKGSGMAKFDFFKSSTTYWTDFFIITTYIVVHQSHCDIVWKNSCIVHMCDKSIHDITDRCSIFAGNVSRKIGTISVWWYDIMMNWYRFRVAWQVTCCAFSALCCHILIPRCGC